jgi:SRSO17 transposase
VVLKVSPYPIPELRAFLRPYRSFFYRLESLRPLERVATGLIADIGRKSGAGIAAAVVDLSDSALYRLLEETRWNPAALNQHRIEAMCQLAVAGDGVLAADDA